MINVCRRAQKRSIASPFALLLALVPLALSIASCKAEPAPPPSGPTATPAATSAAPTTISERGDQAPHAPATSASSGPSATAARPARIWTFDADKPNEPPSAFSFGRTGDGRPGRWIIKTEPDAPSAGNVLAQLDADDTDMRFPVAVANEPSFRDVRLSVKCKPVSGKVAQACGLEAAFGIKGVAKDGMYKVTIGRPATTAACGCQIGKTMGVNTWAAFAGTNEDAVVDGDFAVTEDELQPVLKSLRGDGIHVVAIHHHMVGEQPRILFLHYWGRGPAETLATNVKKAVGLTKAGG